MRPQRRVQLVEDDARFDPGPSLGGVHLHDAVEILRRIELQAGADRLARLRRAAAARGDRHGVAARHLHRRHHIVCGPRDDDAEWLDLVHARIGGVERARHPIEAQIADDLAREVAFELRSGHGKL